MLNLPYLVNKRSLILPKEPRIHMDLNMVGQFSTGNLADFILPDVDVFSITDNSSVNDMFLNDAAPLEALDRPMWGDNFDAPSDEFMKNLASLKMPEFSDTDKQEIAGNFCDKELDELAAVACAEIPHYPDIVDIMPELPFIDMSSVSSASSSASSPPILPPKKPRKPNRKRPRRNLSAHAVEILSTWFLKAGDNPYAKAPEVEQLARETGLEVGQVRNWLSNFRKRTWLPEMRKRRRLEDEDLLAATQISETADEPSNSRKGAWTEAEEIYADGLRRGFADGQLNCPPGISLRAYLAGKLGCNEMRISKKFTGKLAVGKKFYQHVAGAPTASYEMEMDELRMNFLESVNKQAL